MPPINMENPVLLQNKIFPSRKNKQKKTPPKSIITQTYLHKIPDYIILRSWDKEEKDKELVLKEGKEGNFWAIP